ncbi:hypothetical protein Tco_0718814 [Tanacetum coccineum]
MQSCQSMLGSDLQGEDFAKKMPLKLVKRFGEELQTKTTKRLKDDEAKDAEPAKKSGKRRKQMARKGLHTDLDKDDSEGSDEVSEHNILSQELKSNNPVSCDVKDISLDMNLTELYRIVMNRYGIDRPEDELEKVFWKYLKNMFEEPLSTDPIWSLLSQQRKYPLSAEICKTMLNKKLQGGKPDENCYKMLKMMEKQAGIRK